MAEEKKEKPKKKKRPTPLKRDGQNNQKKLINRQFKTRLKTATRSFETSLSKKESNDLLKERLNVLFSLLDKSVKKKIMKKNRADRKKSMFSNLVKG